jgi:hypothetical protein
MRVHNIKRSVSCAAALQTAGGDDCWFDAPAAPASPQWPAAASFGALASGQQYRDFGAAAAAAIAAAVASCDLQAAGAEG